MKRFLIPFMAVLLIGTLFITSDVFGISIKSYGIYLHCNGNASFLEEKICDNCSPSITASPLNKWYYINNEIAISENGDIIEFFHTGFGSNYSLPYRFNFSDEAAMFAKEVCSEDITPVLNYLKENELNKNYNDFYPYYPEGAENVEKISDEWYLESHLMDSTKADQIVSVPIEMYIIFGFFTIAVILLIIYTWKKLRGKKKVKK